MARWRLDTYMYAPKDDLKHRAVWRERYLDHPLVGTIARRLIWTFTAKGKAVDGTWHGGALVGRNGKPLNLKGEPTVALWHPIDRAMDDVLAWRIIPNPTAAAVDNCRLAVEKRRHVRLLCLIIAAVLSVKRWRPRKLIGGAMMKP